MSEISELTNSTKEQPYIHFELSSDTDNAKLESNSDSKDLVTKVSSGDWSEWSDCSATCGNATKSRNRMWFEKNQTETQIEPCQNVSCEDDGDDNCFNIFSKSTSFQFWFLTSGLNLNFSMMLCL